MEIYMKAFQNSVYDVKFQVVDLLIAGNLEIKV